MFTLKGTDEQARHMMALAANASQPMGMGFLHYQETEYTAEDMGEKIEGELYLDYFHGRMVKFGVDKVDENTYQVRSMDPQYDYQSWCSTYPTVRALVEASGMEIVSND